MKPADDNPTGFWENLGIYEINEQIFSQFGGSWHEPPEFPPNWENSTELVPLHKRANQIIKSDFKRSRCWAWKDPRSAVLLPFWRKHLPNLRFVLCVRNPLDVASSLSRRENFPTAKGIHLWSLYTAAALLHTKGAARTITLYENYFEDWRTELSRVTQFLGLPNSQLRQSKKQIESFIQQELWHHRSNSVAMLQADSLEPACKALYSALLQALKIKDTGFSDCAANSEMHLNVLSQLVWQQLGQEKELGKLSAELQHAQTARQKIEETFARHEQDASAYQDQLLQEIESGKKTYEKLDAHFSQVEQQSEAQLAENQKQNESLQAENAELAQTGLQTRAMLEAMQNGLLVRLGRQWWIRKDRLLPPSSVRRKAYDYGMRKIKHLMNVPAGIPGIPTNGSKASVIWGRSSASHGSDSPSQTVSTNLSEARIRTPLQTENGCVQVPHDWRNADRPAVVVAVLTWNKRELLQNCLQSIFATTSYPYYRICVFNQASEDGTREYLDSLGSKVDVIHSPQNVGFIPGNNFMMQHYPDWDVVLLNDDTVVTEGWLEKLIECAYSSENIGIVGPKLIYPDGRLQEAGSVVYRDGSARARGKYEDQWNIEYNQICEVDYISACCNYVKRQVINVIGYLDEYFKPSTYEDSDYAFRVREAGFKVVYQPYSTVIHLERQTIGDDAFRRMEINKKRFAERWRHRLAQHPKSLWEVPETPGKAKILVVARIVPDYDRSSGGFRFYQFLRILSRHYNVVYAYLDSYVVDEYVKPLKRLGITAFWRGYARSVGCEILDLGAILRDNDFKVVIFALYDVAAEHLSLAKQYAPQAKIIVDTYDVHFLREMREAELKNNAELRQRARRTKKRELETYRAADLVFTVTDEDRRCLLAEDPKLSVDVVPNIHVLPEQVQDHTNRQGLLFVGGFSHPPNVDAVVHFCQEILPLVKRSLPEIQTHIVGNAPPFEIIALGKNGVHVTGHVPNIRPYLESALVSVAPIRFGSGMKGKVGEALAYGVPVVTTSIAAEGMNLEHEKNALIADTPKEFAEAIVRLHQDEELWNRLARQGREHVQQNWSFDQVDKKLRGIIARMLDEQVETAPTVMVGGAEQSL